MTDKKKIADLRSNMAPKVDTDKGKLGWLDKDGRPFPAGHELGTDSGHKPAGGKPDRNQPGLRQPEVAPEKLRKHAT